MGSGISSSAASHLLKTFFTVTRKHPLEVAAADVFDFLAHQRGDRTVVRLADRESGLSGGGGHAVRSASVGERRAARVAGYRPATAPMARAAPIPP
jgi:hypothetical protein